MDGELDQSSHELLLQIKQDTTHIRESLKEIQGVLGSPKSNVEGVHIAVATVTRIQEQATHNREVEPSLPNTVSWQGDLPVTTSGWVPPGSVIQPQPQPQAHGNQPLGLTHEDEMLELRNTLKRSEDGYDKLEKKYELLKGRFLRNVTNDFEAIDSKIIPEIPKIDTEIQRMVRNYSQDMPIDPKDVRKHSKLWDDWFVKLEQVPKPASGISMSDVNALGCYWLRSRLYTIVAQHILNNQVYGLPSQLESHLAEFERQIMKHSVDGDVSDWRALTMRYCSKIGRSDRDHEQAVRAMLELFHYWYPDSTKKSSKSLRADAHISNCPPELIQGIRGICAMAYDLSMQLRKSAERYEFHDIPEGKTVQSQHNEDCIVEGATTRTSDLVGANVWLNLFGVLIKRTEANERFVVVKAKVICNLHG